MELDLYLISEKYKAKKKQIHFIIAIVIHLFTKSVMAALDNNLTQLNQWQMQYHAKESEKLNLSFRENMTSGEN